MAARESRECEVGEGVKEACKGEFKRSGLDISERDLTGVERSVVSVVRACSWRLGASPLCAHPVFGCALLTRAGCGCRAQFEDSDVL